MAAAAESASFHYLQHQQVKLKPNFVQVKEVVPPTFEELWGTGEDLPRKVLKKEEKLFWRTRHRLEFTIEEARAKACIVVSVRDVDNDKVWRPIVVDCKVLFPLIDDKKTVKKGSGLEDDKLGRAACDYLLARLKPSNGEQPLPHWYCTKHATEDEGAQNILVEGDQEPKSAAGGAEGMIESTDVSSEVMEQQAIVDKLSHDTWDNLERSPPDGLLDDNQWIVQWKEKISTLEAAAETTAVTAPINTQETDSVRSNSETVIDEAQEVVKKDKAQEVSATITEAPKSAGVANNLDKTQVKVSSGDSSSKGSKKVAPAPPLSDPKKKVTTAAPKPKNSTTKPVPLKKGKSNKVSPS